MHSFIPGCTRISCETELQGLKGPLMSNMLSLIHCSLLKISTVYFSESSVENFSIAEVFFFRSEDCLSEPGILPSSPQNTAHSARVGFNYWQKGNPDCVRISNVFAHHTTEIGIVYARKGLSIEAENIMLSDNRYEANRAAPLATPLATYVCLLFAHLCSHLGWCRKHRHSTVAQ